MRDTHEVRSPAPLRGVSPLETLSSSIARGGLESVHGDGAPSPRRHATTVVPISVLPREHSRMISVVNAMF